MYLHSTWVYGVIWIYCAIRRRTLQLVCQNANHHANHALHRCRQASQVSTTCWSDLTHESQPFDRYPFQIRVHQLSPRTLPDLLSMEEVCFYRFEVVPVQSSPFWVTRRTPYFHLRYGLLSFENTSCQTSQVFKHNFSCCKEVSMHSVKNSNLSLHMDPCHLKAATVSMLMQTTVYFPLFKHTTTKAYESAVECCDQYLRSSRI